MAKKNKETTSNKLDLGQTLLALDLKNKNYFIELDNQQKKNYSPFILMRYMSSCPDQNGLHEYHLLAVNDILNQDFWTLSKDQEFQHLLLCLIGLKKKQFHKWIPLPKKSTKNKVKEFFNRIYPGIRETELQILYQNYNIQEFAELCETYGLQDNEVKELVDNYEQIKKIRT